MSSERVVADRPVTGEEQPGGPAISVADLTKTYHIYRRPHHRLLQWLADRNDWGHQYAMAVHAVSDVSFEVEHGETVVILGRNGSGKSTLLQMIAGTLTPTSGTIDVRGQVSALLELGAGFNPDYTGRENLRLNARIFGLSADEIERAEPEIEAFADIGAFIDEPVRTYSSGMYVRLAFATAINLVPDVLIVDEALAVGDVFFQQKCIDYIVNRMNRATKLIVTHDVGTASRLGDRVLVMDAGRLVFDGEPLQGIEFFTSLNLRDRAVPPAPAHEYASVPHDGEVVPLSLAGSPPHESFIELSPDKSSNADAITFRRIALGAMHGQSRVWHPKPTLSEGQPFAMVCDFDLHVPLTAPIFGYLVRDRLGNVAFGQNTLGSGHRLTPLQPGHHRVVLEIEWPELAEGEYTVTVGAGEGSHALHHFIVCWAQNIASVVNSPARPVHGVFNADITQVSVGHPAR